MTNEEAKEILKRVEIAKPIKFEDYADMREALDMAIKALERTRWIPIKTRPMTEEEKEHYSEILERSFEEVYTILDCTLPDDGQEVIVSSNGYVGTDIFCRDSTDGCYFEGYDIDDVDAWMPLPQPYKAESEET